MIVITMNNCPMRLRGDLSKWLMEINTGVFVGHVNAKVREKLWERVCSNIKDGQATMVYNMANEQHMEFRVHNTKWQPVDYEGIKLIKRPITGCGADGTDKEDKLQPGFSKASRRRMGVRRRKERSAEEYVLIDIETTGLDCESDKITEIAALCCNGYEITKKWSTLIAYENISIPKKIEELTGITKEMCQSEGTSLKEAIKELNNHIGGRTVVIYNSVFDMSFLERAADEAEEELNITRVIDVPQRVKRVVRDLPNYKLETVAKHFGIDTNGSHRALNDCMILYQIFLKLNEI